jgi:transaldolase/glucose-6-phosphate isomerase
MNVLVLGGRVVGIELARELIRAFLTANFSGEGRHVRRLAKITALENRLRSLQVFGQSVWLDYIRRSLITSGELRRLIDEDGLAGVTSNPAIFEKAIAGSSDYQEILESPEARALDAKALYEKLAVRDIKTPPMCCFRFTNRHQSATATSVWKFRRFWPTTQREHWMKRAAYGARWDAIT